VAGCVGRADGRGSAHGRLCRRRRAGPSGAQW
jgi:hypothetical protein